MHDVLFDWLTAKSSYYKDTIALHDEIERLVIKENDEGFPKFISKSRDELEYQDAICPLNWELGHVRDKTPHGWAKPALTKLKEDVRLFVNFPYHSIFIMVGIKGSDIPFSVRNSKDLPSKGKLERLLEKYVDSIRKTEKEIEILAEKLANPKHSREEVIKIVNNYTLADEIKL